MTTKATTEIVPENGVTVFIPLNKLKKHPKNARKANVAATDRRAIFVGPEAYTEAGGNIIRDLFTEDRGGFYEDPALLDRLVIEKLERIAAEVQAEGWKWAQVHIDYPHAHGMRRAYPQTMELSEEDAAAYDAAQEEYERLSSEYESAEELPDDVDQRFGELEAEIERIDALRHAYDPDEIARSGVFVVLSHDGDLTALLAANGRADALAAAERAAAAEQGREQRRRFLTPGSGYQPGNAQMFPGGN